MPNIEVKTPIEVDGFALASIHDARVRELAEAHPNFREFLNRFTTEFGRPIIPSVFICRDDVPATYRGIDAIAGFRDAIAMSVIQQSWAKVLRFGNTIPVERQAQFPGDIAMEERIAAIVRWNALAMVVRANNAYGEIGGHIASFASAAEILETGFNHFFRADGGIGDIVFFQPHSAPGVYARAFLEGRLTESNLDRFRREIGGGGLCSYPHPWLMPTFWQVPTGSMGLGPIMGVYQARFIRYLADRGLADAQHRRVWGVFGNASVHPRAPAAVARAEEPGIVVGAPSAREASEISASPVREAERSLKPPSKKPRLTSRDERAVVAASYVRIVPARHANRPSPLSTGNAAHDSVVRHDNSNVVYLDESIVGRTVGVTGDIVAATQRAILAVAVIPSWIRSIGRKGQSPRQLANSAAEREPRSCNKVSMTHGSDASNSSFAHCDHINHIRAWNERYGYAGPRAMMTDATGDGSGQV